MSKLIHIKCASDQVTSKDLARLIETRRLTNAKLARILGVEGWTVGAWLSGKREISEKYKNQIAELLRLPKEADLYLAPTARQLSSKIQQIQDWSDRPHIVEAMVAVNKAAANALLRFSSSSIDPTELCAIEELLKAYDDHSIAQLSQLIAVILVERVRIAALSPKEYAEECIERASKAGSSLQFRGPEGSILGVDLTIDMDEEERLYEKKDLFDGANELFGFGQGPELTFHPDPSKCLLSKVDRHRVLQEIRDEHRDFVEEKAKLLFKETAFTEDRINHQWLDSTLFAAAYKIDLQHPRFKESLRVVMDRQGLK
jgi:hypothetical protein